MTERNGNDESLFRVRIGSLRLDCLTGRSSRGSNPQRNASAELSLKTFIQIYAKVSSSNTKHTIVNLYIYIYIVYIVRRSRILENLLRHSRQFKVALILRIVPTTTTLFLILLLNNKIQNLKATVFLPRLTRVLSVFKYLVLLPQ